MKECLNCKKPISDKKKYCNNKCQQEYKHKIYIEKWKSGIVDGGIGNWGDISGHIRKYLFEKYNNKCSKCGWGEINPYTKTIPLEVEHMDGNAMNHSEQNLTLLCPNCHALTKTYKGANRGNGRGLTWTPSEKTIRFEVIKKEKIERFCAYCGKLLTNRQKIYCSKECKNKDYHKNRPSKEELIEDLKTMTMIAMGNKYNVSNNTVKNWCIKYEII